MSILGYNPMHFYEVIAGGPKALRILNEGIYADLNRGQFSIKPYDEKDFKKWFAPYDVRMPHPPLSDAQVVTSFNRFTDKIRSASLRCAASLRARELPRSILTIRTSNSSSRSVIPQAGLDLSTALEAKQRSRCLGSQ